MKIQIKFFEKDFIKAIGAGIYEVTMIYNNTETSLYIGESVFVLIRCATHLFNVKKNPNYFGFTDETIEDEKIELRFSLLESEDDMQIRKQKEKIYIQTNEPKLQSGISDRMKAIDDKIQEITYLLESKMGE